MSLNNFLLSKVEEKGADSLAMEEKIQLFTGISPIKLMSLMKEHTINQLAQFVDILPITETQRNKLKVLFSFSNDLNQVLYLAENNKLDSTIKAGEYIKTILKNKTYENFCITLLDSGKRVIKTINMGEGTIDRAAIYPRNILEKVLNYKATSVILSHNHPGGLCRPSGEDISTTKRVKDALKVIGAEVVDHIIIADDKHYSFAENGLI